MKIEINENERPIKFPCLMQSSNGNIFYFGSDEQQAVCLLSVGAGFKSGQFAPSVKYEKLTPFKGTITLSND